LGMVIDFSCKGKVKFKMDDYVEEMLSEFPKKMRSNDTSLTPASTSLFDNSNSKLLDAHKKEQYHTYAAKCLFLSKRARPDIRLTVAVLPTRVKAPTNQDWLRLERLMKYLNGTRTFHLTVGIDDIKVIKWYVDASYGVHEDLRSHTGSVMSMGTGALQAGSGKQKLNTRSSTEAELVGVDDVLAKILWTKLFIEEQGYEIEKNILFQDNKSSILLETNGRKSVGKRSRHINIRYFFRYRSG